jgi:hypothetical protein
VLRVSQSCFSIAVVAALSAETFSMLCCISASKGLGLRGASVGSGGGEGGEKALIPSCHAPSSDLGRDGDSRGNLRLGNETSDATRGGWRSEIGFFFDKIVSSSLSAL